MEIPKQVRDDMVGDGIWEKVMTIYSSVSRARYIGNGVTKNFTVPFYFQANKDGAAQLGVYLGDSDVPLREGTDYTVNGVNNSNGGEIVFAVAPQNGEQIAINRNIPLIQETKFKNGGNFPAESYEQSLDKVTMQIQEVKENLARAIVLPPTSDEDPLQARNDILAARDEAVDSASAAAQSESAALNSKNAAANSATQAENSANVATTAKNTILNDAGFQVVAADLRGENKIGYVADNLDVVAENVGRAEQAATTASEAAEQAATAASEAQATIENETAQALQEISSNATSQTQAFNSNATNKTTTFNNNAATKQSQVDASATAAASSASTAATKATQAANSATAAANTLAQVTPAVEAGLDQLANASNALRTTQITNCVLENPQLVSLSLSNGSLTMAAGSTVIVPYGTSAPTKSVGDSLNGGIITDISWGSNKLFYYVKYSSAKTHKDTLSRQLVEYVHSSNALTGMHKDKVFSGSTSPTTTGYAIWYDTANNFVKSTSDGGTSWSGTHSLPFAVLTATTDGFTSIDQTFQSIGCVGSTVWVGKGVKGLVPNGRNSDGSLNNILASTGNWLYTLTLPANIDVDFQIGLNGGLGRSLYTYNEEENNIYNSSGVISNDRYFAGHVTTDSTAKITSFTPKSTFHATDYYDFEKLSKDVATKDAENVKTSGAQNIGGVKTFNGSILSTAGAGGALFGKANGLNVGGLYFLKNTNNNTIILQVQKDDNSASHNFYFRYNNGNAILNLAASPAAGDNSTNAATTSWVRNLFTGSLAQNGYVKIPISGQTNPLIIQWGHQTSASNGTITFPTPFSSVNYSFSSMSKDSGGSVGAHSVTYTAKTVSNYSYQTRTGSGGAVALEFDWVAIGY